VNMHIDNLRSTLEELQEELHAVEQLDPQTRELLVEAKSEMDRALHRDDPESLESSSLIERLERAGHDFDQSHPSLSRIVGNLIDALGQMGI
jgi:hypothetical protein